MKRRILFVFVIMVLLMAAPLVYAADAATGNASSVSGAGFGYGLAAGSAGKPAGAPADGSSGEETAPLTYERAVELALKNSIDLRSAKQSVEQAEEMRDQASVLKSIGYLPMGPGLGDEDAAARSVLLSFLQADTSWQMAKKQVEITEEAIAFRVRATFDDVKKKNKEIELAESSLDLTALKLQQAAFKAKQGLESPFTLQDQQNQFAEEKQRKELLDKQLDETYLKLNHLLGLEKDERYALADGTKANAQHQDDETGNGVAKADADVPESNGNGNDTTSIFLEEKIDLDAHIRRVLNDHPYIWLQEQTIKLAEHEVSLHTYNVMSAPYAVKQIEVNKEKDKLASLRKNAEEMLRSSYLQLGQMEDQYKALEVGLARAENMLKMVLARQKVGMVTTSDIRQAELAIAQIRLQMENILIAYEQLRLLFHKPWLSPAF